MVRHARSANGSAASHAERLRRETGALRDLVTAVCEGLRRPHTDDRIHRDIKPANVLLLDGTWVVADWGLADQPEGNQHSAPNSDRHRLRLRRFRRAGAVVRKPPQSDDRRRHLQHRAAHRSHRNRGTTGAESPSCCSPAGPWVAVVAEATRHKPTDRPQDVDEFLRLLKDIP
ncbi:protein kinase domain-containing protein [Salinispora arenicola]|uniref:protein kinase domain-containing protein n=1 Tax=Salinispora arenicola TaxID=168697 RepID=UPI00169E45EB|nr:hypothetical protein [Salinispora arenicola]